VSIVEKKEFETECTILIEKHDRDTKHGKSVFYKLFIDYEWVADIGTKEILITTLEQHSILSEDEIKKMVGDEF